MESKNTFILWFVIYITLSVISQFLTSTPVTICTIFGVTIWTTLASITIVPMVDVFRSFTQHHGERAGLQFKHVGSLMMVTTFVVSGLCVMFAGLPLPIFVGVLAAVTVGGAFDILVFRHMGKYFTNPVARMAFSNLMATLVGSGIVFLVAFTDVFFANNTMARPVHEVIVGWLSQSTFIYLSGLTLAFITSKLTKTK